MILGICGNIGAGKSSLSNLLIQEFFFKTIIGKVQGESLFRKFL